MKEKALYEQLIELSKSDFLPMHMPGGKRKKQGFPDPFTVDITEITDFDNLHHPEGVLRDEMKRAAMLFGADETLFGTNGSTGCILAAICGALPKGSKVLLARNCHTSVYHAVELAELDPVYLLPTVLNEQAGIYGAVDPGSVKDCLAKDPDIKALILTSPTYEGVVSDIRQLSDICHEKNVLLIVDEAHGAHFGFDLSFPQTAVRLGADAVIQSLHKTLPTLTQAALLHVNGDLIDRERVRRYWDMFQTTSPSYLIMGSMSRCLQWLEQDGALQMKDYAHRLQKIRERLSHLTHVRLLAPNLPTYGLDTAYDIGKLVFLTDNGPAAAKWLRDEKHIELEMSSLKYFIAMTSPMDTESDLDRFAKALEQLDAHSKETGPSAGSARFLAGSLPEKILKPSEAAVLADRADRTQLVPVKDLAGRVAGEAVCLYPPGIPLVVAGERFSRKEQAVLVAAQKAGLPTLGVREDSVKCLKLSS